jgi:aryl-alcohol dehydrogenase-like predicted oxidoreductase
VSVARVALSWMLAQPHVTSVIIGAKDDKQLDDNIAATTLTLSAEELTALDAASALPPEYPGWMVSWQNREPR